MKFKIGDIVKGTKSCPSDLTNEKLRRAEVVAIRTGFKADTCIRIIDYKGNVFDGTYWVSHDYLELVYDEEIHITVKGSDIHAVLKNGKDVVRRSVIKFRPEYVFDFNAGVKLAFDRLFEDTIEQKKYVQITSNKNETTHWYNVGDVCEIHRESENYYYLRRLYDNIYQSVKKEDVRVLHIVQRQAKKGEYILLIKNPYSFNKMGDVLCVDGVNENCVQAFERNHSRETSGTSPEYSWNYTTYDYVVLVDYEPLEEFSPHLESSEHMHYGVIGTKTKMKDIRGEELCIGDTVLLINADSGRAYSGEHFVVERDGDQFVMAIRGCCNADGTITGWHVVKKSSYTELYDEKMCGGITAVIKEK